MSSKRQIERDCSPYDSLKLWFSVFLVAQLAQVALLSLSLLAGTGASCAKFSYESRHEKTFAFKVKICYNNCSCTGSPKFWGGRTWLFGTSGTLVELSAKVLFFIRKGGDYFVRDVL